ncbi:tetratricopeptide repeat protein [Clostridium sp. UBA6640]|uniref:tetratricopeptide repeat protein n=1 Tax=Clostridium sp. UBA6640 TaxID=1946370 RepID=UPI0025BCD8C9|nr:tetratricopeptide repeat protein [Clostridium sp. UBA6640]
MNRDLDLAINLRKSGKLRESNELLVELANAHPEDAMINYHCACGLDALGLDVHAIHYYENAIYGELPRNDLQEAIINLGNNYRALGRYVKARQVFEYGLNIFPKNNAIKVFYAMTLYNLKEHEKSIEILLKVLAKTSNDENIMRYKKVLQFYSDKLDMRW